MQRELIVHNLILFFKQYSKLSLSEGVAINNDLKFTIAEYDELKLFIKERYKTNLEALNPNVYFNDEIPSLMEFINKVFNKKTTKKNPPFTIGHLAKVIERGEWFEPEPNE